MTSILTQEQQNFLKDSELEFKDRYTESDERFMKVKSSVIRKPPIVDPWHNTAQRSNNWPRRDRQRHGHERNRYRDGNRDRDRHYQNPDERSSSSSRKNGKHKVKKRHGDIHSILNKDYPEKKDRDRAKKKSKKKSKKKEKSRYHEDSRSDKSPKGKKNLNTEKNYDKNDVCKEGYKISDTVEHDKNMVSHAKHIWFDDSLQPSCSRSSCDPNPFRISQNEDDHQSQDFQGNCLKTLGKTEANTRSKSPLDNSFKIIKKENNYRRSESPSYNPFRITNSDRNDENERNHSYKSCRIPNKSNHTRRAQSPCYDRTSYKRKNDSPSTSYDSSRLSKKRKIDYYERKPLYMQTQKNYNREESPSYNPFRISEKYEKDQAANFSEQFFEKIPSHDQPDQSNLPCKLNETTKNQRTLNDFEKTHDVQPNQPNLPCILNETTENQRTLNDFEKTHDDQPDQSNLPCILNEATENQRTLNDFEKTHDEKNSVFENIVYAQKEIDNFENNNKVQPMFISENPLKNQQQVLIFEESEISQQKIFVSEELALDQPQNYPEKPVNDHKEGTPKKHIKNRRQKRIIDDPVRHDHCYSKLSYM
ncbi:uncharacterized protein DDB_G0287625-like isoform X1 [Trichogramma pretiosum]|uniref:uncharacterized protein DDB_G0287625-like isoform X1 n=1 Tax=Trichogramma pretiosum TaxID=7493 RepID=UPI000C7195C9|nr:uncharacterized protein DDB_G0287625-like isoform X1 [Trichogramma pretiosum]